MTIVALWCAAGGIPGAELFVCGLPTDRAVLADFSRLQAGGLGNVGSSVKEVKLPGLTVYFHENVWQASKIRSQLELYKELYGIGSRDALMTDVITLESSALASRNLHASPKPKRALVVLRRCVLNGPRGPLTVELRSQPEDVDGHPIAISAPQMAVPTDESGLPPTPWVRYPTSYGFMVLGSGDRTVSQEVEFQFRADAIRTIEAHLDAFCNKRLAALAAIERAKDGIDAAALLGKEVRELPKALKERIRAIASAKGSTLPAGARVLSVDSRLFVEERSSAGEVVDIEVP
ncbi:MAG: hypothetical protein ACYC96_01900 [Fimbriimonadaceae bacterium]